MSYPFQLVLCPLNVKPDALTKSLKSIRQSPSQLVIALDPHGSLNDSNRWSQYLTQWLTEGTQIHFIIGPADGLDSQTKLLCQQQWSLSPLTFSHALSWLITCEQIYRITSNHLGHPYHRDGKAT